MNMRTRLDSLSELKDTLEVIMHDNPGKSISQVISESFEEYPVWLASMGDFIVEDVLQRKFLSSQDANIALRFLEQQYTYFDEQSDRNLLGYEEDRGTDKLHYLIGAESALTNAKKAVDGMILVSKKSEDVNGQIDIHRVAWNELQREAVRIYLIRKNPKNYKYMLGLWNNLVDIVRVENYERACVIRDQISAIVPDFKYWPIST